MELDELKSAWNTLATPAKAEEEILSMLKENNHPVLKGIRKQLLIEVIGWSAFLLAYYTMFDGDQKPLLINMALVIAVLFSLLHNLTGYGLAKHLISGTSIRESLQHYLSKVKTYATIAVVSRAFLCAGFLLFFTYNISFTSSKYFMLGVAIVIFIGQLMLLTRIWLTRLKRLKASLADFT
jgi:hypothetical protein